MKRLTILLGIIIMGIYNQTHAQNQDSLIKVTEGVYEITGLYCNISFLVTEDGVILFDTGNYPDKGDRIQKIIKSVSKKPIKYIVYTHYHGDHTNGIAMFSSKIPIIAQKNSVKNLQNQENDRIKELKNVNKQIDSLKLLLSKIKAVKSAIYTKNDSIYKTFLEKAKELKSIKTIYPTILVENEKTIVLGKDTIEFTFPGKAHTDGDLVANIKTRKTIIFGDLLFNKCYPYIDPLGDVLNWSGKMKFYAQSGTEYFIPGHCDIANKEDVLIFANYLNDIYNEVKKLKDEGKAIEEIRKTVNLPTYDNFGFTFLKAQNVDGVYSQLK